jgi:hypothetical protein
MRRPHALVSTTCIHRDVGRKTVAKYAVPASKASIM